MSNYIWLFDGNAYASLEAVQDQILDQYGEWAIKPSIEIQREDYCCWRVPNNDLLEAFRTPLFGTKQAS